MQKVGIIGCGRMGQRIAKVVSGAFDVIVYDTDPTKLQCLANTPNISLTSNISDVSVCFLIIECVFEDLRIKQHVFKEIEPIIENNAIIATNTSSLLISDLAKVVQNKKRFLGMHFMNPPEKIDLVELIKSEHTSDETISIIQAFLKKINKTPVLSMDVPGFILNRILITMLNEALIVLENGIASKEDIDLTMTLGAKFSIGPIALVDMIGLDIIKNVMDNFTKAFGDKYAAAKILDKYISDGRLGKKVGHGFYDYVN